MANELADVDLDDRGSCGSLAVAFAVPPVMKLDTNDFIPPAAVVPLLIRFTGKGDVIARSRNRSELLERNQIDPALQDNVMETHAILTHRLQLSSFSNLQIEIPGRDRKDWNADDCDNIGNKADWVRPRKAHIKGYPCIRRKSRAKSELR